MVNYCSMTVIYAGILTLEILGFFTAVIYRSIFITLAPGANVIKLFTAVSYDFS